MPRPPGALNRANRGDTYKKGPNIDTSEERVKKLAEIRQIDGEVLDAMSKTNRMRLTHSDPANLSLRQVQTAGAEFLASLVGHPEFRKRLVEEGLKDPVSILKIASSERPKEIHMEADIQHSVVVVPTQLSAADWEDKIKTIQENQTIEAEWEDK